MVQRGPMQILAGTSEIPRRANRSPEIIVIDDSEDECDSSNTPDGDTAAFGITEDQSVIENDGDDDDGNDEIQFGETFTCEQVVQQKFDRAAANGEIVVIDWENVRKKTLMLT